MFLLLAALRLPFNIVLSIVSVSLIIFSFVALIFTSVVLFSYFYSGNNSNFTYFFS